MRLSHPSIPYQGIPQENVFFAYNEQYVQMGMGYIILSMQPELYPDRPLQLYLYIKAQPTGRNILLGALLARAEQMRAMYPYLRGRIYTQLLPTEWDMLNFYNHNGFSNNDSEDEYIFTLPEASEVIPPMSCQFASVPLQTPEMSRAFLDRMNLYRLSPITMDYLSVQLQQPYFMALGYYRGGQPIAEIMLSGTGGDSAGLIMMYVRAEYRKRGIAKSLLTAASGLLRERGITQCMAHVYSGNAPQVALMKSFAASRRRIVSILPTIDIG